MHIFHARARPGELAAKHHDCGFGNAVNARALLGGGQSRSHTTTPEAFGEGPQPTWPSSGPAEGYTGSTHKPWHFWRVKGVGSQAALRETQSCCDAALGVHSLYCCCWLLPGPRLKDHGSCLSLGGQERRLSAAMGGSSWDLSSLTEGGEEEANPPGAVGGALRT